jgi:hypothetical protein
MVQPPSCLGETLESGRFRAEARAVEGRRIRVRLSRGVRIRRKVALGGYGRAVCSAHLTSRTTEGAQRIYGYIA